MKSAFIIFFMLPLLHIANAQTESEIDFLLNQLSTIENSKDISITEQGIEVVEFGKEALPILASFFTDETPTSISSECQDKFLTKGEVAIILADRIELMPYAKLTGIQNCTLTFCEGNPNLIEYYLWAIEREGVEHFKEKYISWLESNERMKYKELYRPAKKKKPKRKKKLPQYRP